MKDQLTTQTFKTAFIEWLIQHHVEETERWARLSHREWESLAEHHWQRLESLLRERRRGNLDQLPDWPVPEPESEPVAPVDWEDDDE